MPEKKSVTHSALCIMTSFHEKRNDVYACYSDDKNVMFEQGEDIMIQAWIFFIRNWFYTAMSAKCSFYCLFHDLTYCAFFKSYYRLLSSCITEYKLVLLFSLPAQTVRQF